MFFQKPELEVITFNREDVITTSGYCDGAPVDLWHLYGNGCNYDPSQDVDDD